MSFSSLLFIATCWGCYRLGAFNERHPGELNNRATHAWHWLCEWLKKAE